MKESDNYPYAKINDIYYYIPHPIKALEFGFFRLEDTGEVFKVTGVKPNVMPTCLDFEKNESNLIYQGEMPIAKRV